MQQQPSKNPAKKTAKTWQKPGKNPAKRMVFRWMFLRVLGLANAWCRKLEEEEMKEEEKEKE